MSPALNNFLEDRRQRDPTHAVETVLLILRLIFYFGKWIQWNSLFEGKYRKSLIFVCLDFEIGYSPALHERTPRVTWCYVREMRIMSRGTRDTFCETKSREGSEGQSREKRGTTRRVWWEITLEYRDFSSG